MKHPLIIYVIACLWCWGTLAPIRGNPLWVTLSGESQASSGPTSPGTTNLLAWYDLDNNGTDASGNARNLSTQGSPTYTTAHIGTHSLLIDATNEWLFRTDEAWMTPGSGGLTVCAWVRPTDSTPAGGSTVGVVSHYGNLAAERSWYLGILSTGYPRFTVSSDGTTLVGASGTVILPDATWSFIVGTWEPSTAVKIYYNGSLATTNTTSVPAALVNSTTNLRVGSYNDESTNSALGNHDGIAIYGRVLTADEIAWLYNSGSGRAYSDL